MINSFSKERNKHGIFAFYFSLPLFRRELSGLRMEELAFSFLPSHDWSLAEQVIFIIRIGGDDDYDGNANGEKIGTGTMIMSIMMLTN